MSFVVHYLGTKIPTHDGFYMEHATVTEYDALDDAPDQHRDMFDWMRRHDVQCIHTGAYVYQVRSIKI